MKLKLVEKDGAKELRESQINKAAKELGLYQEGFSQEDQCGGYQVFRWLIFHPESWISEHRLGSFHPNIKGLVQVAIYRLRKEFYGEVKELYGCDSQMRREQFLH